MDNSQETFGVEPSLERPESPAARSFSRRAFLQRLGLATAAAVTLSYVAPSLLTVTVPKAYAQVGTPTPEPGGCTPGFWKNHTGAWVGYSTGQDFDTVFGVNAFTPNLTLLQALTQKGGGVNALGRHAVAALLNAAALYPSFPLSTAIVIGMVQTALGPGGDIEGTKNEFDTLNNSACGIGGMNADAGDWP